MKTFRHAVRTRDFAVTAEIFLRPESDADAIREQADVLRDHVDAIVVTDNQFGRLHMSPLVAASVLMGDGVDAVVQMTSRNRNRIALLSDLLGAGVIGVTSLLLGRGERASDALKPKPRAVLDVNAVDLLRIASTVKLDESLKYCPDFFVGGVSTPQMPRRNWKAKRLEAKINAGAQFIQTHLCMNIVMLRNYMKHLVSLELLQRTSFIGTVAVIESAEDARWLRENRPNVMIPKSLVERLDGAADPKEEGMQICVETLQALAEIPGMSGAHIIASRDLRTIPEVITRSGVYEPRAAEQP